MKKVNECTKCGWQGNDEQKIDIMQPDGMGLLTCPKCGCGEFYVEPLVKNCTISDVSGWASHKTLKMELTQEQKQEWENWLSERPENVRKVAERIVPWKKYRDTRITDDIGNRYSPRSYEEQEDGSVTITCEKSNEEMPILGGYGVFGMNPDNLVEAD